MRRVRGLLRRLRRGPTFQLPPLSSYQETDVAAYLRQLMLDNYTVDDLRNVSADEFESYITGLPGRHDPAVEGYDDASHQRDLSVEFRWGHNHDFGRFYMHGLMRNRHVDILAAFMTEYGVPERDLRGKKVLDVGCWTGGTSLLLAAMGAEVLAVEEVRKYADCVKYLKHVFALDSLQVEARSLYGLDRKDLWDRFDIVLYSGVLYHVTDPVLSLRTVFNCLKDNGICLLETMACVGKGSYCQYLGARETLSRPRTGQPRSGWNWLVPSMEALHRMMADVGFSVRKATLHGNGRALALGVRTWHVDMLRAGLSNQFIR